MITRIKIFLNIAAALLLAALFMVIATALIFKTAGYSYNLKKGIVELTGILVIKTNPTGAAVVLNGKRLDKKTPLRARNLDQNVYDIRLEIANFHPWAAPLRVESARATFAQTIRLYPERSPELVATGTIHTAALSSDGSLIAWTSADRATQRVILYTVPTPTQTTIAGVSATSDVALSWSPLNNHLLLSEHTRDGVLKAAVHLLPPNGPVAIVNDASPGSFSAIRWSVGDPKLLDLISGDTVRSFEPVGGRVAGIISHTTSTRYRAYGPERGGWIPFIDGARGRFMVEQEGRVMSGSNARVRDFTWAPNSSDIRLLLRSDTELWIAAPHGNGSDAPRIDETFLLREGAGIDAAAWSADGASVYVASNGTVSALELTDYGFGRHSTELARFDRVTHLFAPRDDTALFIIGSKDGVEGVWKLALD